MPLIPISAELNEEVRELIFLKISEIFSELPFLVNLTPSERTKIFKMGDKSVSYVEKSFEYAKNNPKLLPEYFDMAEFEKDINLYKSLAPIKYYINQLAESVDDTLMLIGSEVITSATMFYNSVKNAKNANVPGSDSIYEDLRGRFKGRGSSNPNGVSTAEEV